MADCCVHPEPYPTLKYGEGTTRLMFIYCRNCGADECVGSFDGNATDG